MVFDGGFGGFVFDVIILVIVVIVVSAMMRLLAPMIPVVLTRSFGGLGQSQNPYLPRRSPLSSPSGTSTFWIPGITNAFSH